MAEEIKKYKIPPGYYTSEEWKNLQSKKPPQENTLLNDGTQAETERDRRVALRASTRYLVTATYLPHLLFVQLGEKALLDINGPKFSFLDNRKGQIYSIKRNWLNGTVEIGVLV